MSSFNDQFSTQAATYAQHRPTYPQALFDFLGTLTPSRGLAVDCGTGNGQAAVGLAQVFSQVIALDPSQAQIQNAQPHPVIRYAVSPAERLACDDGSADIITAAQAAHWFKLKDFYYEARRVLRPQGIIALWCYTRNWTSTPEIAALVEDYATKWVGRYWAAEIRLVDEQYKTIAFPFTELQMPAFTMRTTWTFDDLLGYLASWSATQNYIKARGENPISKVEGILRTAWGASPKLDFDWPLYFRVGRV